MNVSMIVLYTDDVSAMDRFYGTLFGGPIVPSSDGFHLYPREGQVTIAAWKLGSSDAATANESLGGAELIVEMANRDGVDAEAARVRGLGLEVDGPGDLPFGYAATLIDPSGNRIRIGHFPE